jgi:hypothetical protein
MAGTVHHLCLRDTPDPQLIRTAGLQLLEAGGLGRHICGGGLQHGPPAHTACEVGVSAAAPRRTALAGTSAEESTWR